MDGPRWLHMFITKELLLKIYVGEFKVENTNAHVMFWTLKIERLKKFGFEGGQFAGLMANETQANWLVVLTILNKGKRYVMTHEDRSCYFHWKRSSWSTHGFVSRPNFRKTIRNCANSVGMHQVKPWPSHHSRTNLLPFGYWDIHMRMILAH